MKTAFLNLFTFLRASYWYLPLLLCIATFLIAIITIHIDYNLSADWIEKFYFLNNHSPEGARAVLTIIATTMITVAGVTFSMTILAVSFASSQIGPRIISNFMRDQANQLTLGIFVATFLYCILTLKAVTGVYGEDTAFVPHLSLFIAMLFALCSIIVFIYFLHHIPESINLSNVIANVGEQIYQQCDKLYPYNLGVEQKSSSIDTNFSNKFDLKQDKYGYIRIIDVQAIFNIAKKNDIVIEIITKPGDFATPSSTLVILYANKQISKSIYNQCLEKFAYGNQRNQEQDIHFLITQLNEVIAKALSPGINDPYTAFTALNWLCLSIEKVAQQKTTLPYRFDENDSLRIIVKNTNFADFCNEIFDPSISYISKDYNAAKFTLHKLSQLYQNIEDIEKKQILKNYAKNILDSCSEKLACKNSFVKIDNYFEKHF